ncbi:hypothetical protein K1719_016736 [Acacia pycnantha]|nr:hypothetical protein K1719_016736 [Acacia pycnantha]
MAQVGLGEELPNSNTFSVLRSKEAQLVAETDTQGGGKLPLNSLGPNNGLGMETGFEKKGSVGITILVQEPKEFDVPIAEVRMECASNGDALMCDQDQTVGAAAIPQQPLYCFPMNFMVWNSRGTGARSFPPLIRDLKAHYQLAFVAILETRCSSELSRGRASHLGFSNMELINCEGYSGGIWCLWDHCISLVTVLNGTTALHLLITSSSERLRTITVVYAALHVAPAGVCGTNLTS